MLPLWDGAAVLRRSCEDEELRVAGAELLEEEELLRTDGPELREDELRLAPEECDAPEEWEPPDEWDPPEEWEAELE